MSEKKKDASNILEFKGRPLVRCENILYYGNFSDDYIIRMNIMSNNKINDELEVASNVSVLLIETKSLNKNNEKVIKSSNRDGLYNALDIASIWLDRAMAEKKKAQ